MSRDRNVSGTKTKTKAPALALSARWFSGNPCSMTGRLPSSRYFFCFPLCFPPGGRPLFRDTGGVFPKRAKPVLGAIGNTFAPPRGGGFCAVDCPRFASERIAHKHGENFLQTKPAGLDISVVEFVLPPWLVSLSHPGIAFVQKQVKHQSLNDP